MRRLFRFAFPTHAARSATQFTHTLELNKQAGDYFEKGDFDGAVKCWEEVVAFEKTSLLTGSPNPNLMQSLHNLACAHGELGHTDKKLELLRESLKMIQDVYGDTHPQYAMALYNVASAHGDMGNLGAMKDTLHETLKLHEDRFGLGHPKVGRVLSLLAVAHDKLAEYPDQLRVATRAFTIISKHCGQDHIQTAMAMVALGKAYGNTGDAAKMLQLIQSAYDLQEPRLGAMNPQIAAILLELADAHGRNGEQFIRKELLEKAIEAQKRAFGMFNVQLIDSLSRLGDACVALQDTDAAMHTFLQALRIAEEKRGSSHPIVGTIKSDIAFLHHRCGNDKAAVSFARSAASVLKESSQFKNRADELEELINRIVRS